MKVKALKNFGFEGRNIEPGEVVTWNVAKHGDTWKAFVKQGLVQVIEKDPEPKDAKKPEPKVAPKAKPATTVASPDAAKTAPADAPKTASTEPPAAKA